MLRRLWSPIQKRLAVLDRQLHSCREPGVWDVSRWWAPADCLGCQTNGASPLCASCTQDLESTLRTGCRNCHNPEVGNTATTCTWCRRLRPAPSEIVSLYAYRGKGRDLFQQAKFHGYWRLIPALAQRDLGQLSQVMDLSRYDCLTPIPERFLRKLTRFYNPALEMAQATRAVTGLPIREHLAFKGWGRHQVGLGASARQTNAAGRFCVKGATPEGVILVDDVLTTGATLMAATQALHAAGTPRVAWLTLFRAV